VLGPPQCGQEAGLRRGVPTDTLMFGMKRDLMEVARTRVYRHPRAYHPSLRRARGGGASWLYLAAVPFGSSASLTVSAPRRSRRYHGMLYAVPIISFGVPAFLLALHALSSDSSAKPGPEEKAMTELAELAAPRPLLRFLWASFARAQGTDALQPGVGADHGVGCRADRAAFRAGTRRGDHLSQDFPWGSGGFDVITGVAFAGGAYVLTFMVYLMRAERFHRW